MAEPIDPEPIESEPIDPEPIDSEPRPSAWSAHRVLMGSRIRSQLSYRTSFWMDVTGSVAIALADLVEVYVIFHHVDVFGGLDVTAALLLLALSRLSFGLAGMVAGNLDTVPEYVRTGTLDVLMLRPLPVLAQLVTADLRLRRIGEVATALVVLVIALAQLEVTWTASRIALLVVTPVAGAMIFASLFLLAGAIQFWLLDGGEVVNSLTYGTKYASSVPTAVLPEPLRGLFTYVVPAAFAGYLPTVAMLGLPGSAGLPGWLGWCVPVAAVMIGAAALLAWRAGLARYTGGGG